MGTVQRIALKAFRGIPLLQHPVYHYEFPLSLKYVLHFET